MNPIRIAILDLYEGEPNEGMRCIKQLIDGFRMDHGLDLSYEVFDVRLKEEVPDLGFDAYVSSGGPGSPLASEGSVWEQRYFSLIDGIKKHNSDNPRNKKHLLLICHSMQLYCRHYSYATVKKRKSPAFGVMSIHITKAGRHEPLLRGLPDPFYGFDSREYQVVQPKEEKIMAHGGQLVCIEKDRPHVELERAVMAIRFDEAIFGTQFHPEADSEGTYRYLVRDDKRKAVIETHGEKKYNQMLLHLNEPDKIKLTHRTIVPGFLRMALQAKMV